MKLFKKLLFALTFSTLFSYNLSNQIDLLIKQYNVKLSKKFIKYNTVEYSNNIEVINLFPEGFIIITKNNNYFQILGFSFDSKFNEKSIPDNLKYLLDRYQLELNYFSNNYNINYLFDFSREVEPLISALWDQGAPFNGMCPSGPPGSALGNAVVGCVAVGMAQVMHYWQYPPAGIGSVSYYDSDYGQIAVDFEDAFYDYETMPSTTANQEVQEILFHAGASVHMDYGANGSGAAGGPFTPLDYPSAFSALQEHFAYENSMQFIEKINYSDSEWINIVKADLDNGMPVIYDACASVGCHTWNVDGYNGDYIHCNWGWGGNSNGYFLLNNLNPDPGINFNDDVWAIVGITPGDLVILGDVNLDNTINIQDIIITINIILNSYEFQQNADINEDLIIDILDIVMLVNIILQIN